MCTCMLYKVYKIIITAGSYILNSYRVYIRLVLSLIYSYVVIRYLYTCSSAVYKYVFAIQSVQNYYSI